MKIELLTTFLEVSQTLHFRASAENLFITQAAVSSRIKLLEEELGVLLFDRTQKRLKLTPEGHRLVKHANEMMIMWQKLKQDVGVSDAHNSQLFVGSMMSIWDIVLQDWLQKIDRNLDDVQLHIHNHSPIELRKQLLNRLIDIAFIFEPPYVEDIVTEKVGNVPLQLVSTDPNACVSNLNNMIQVDYGEAVNSQFDRDFSESSTVKHRMSQPRIALNFILEASGTAYLPKQMCFEHLRKNKLFLVENAPVYTREIFAMYLAKSHKAQLIQDSLMLFPYTRS
ncbi:LysR family transcriptional regulator [Pseudoalteromonas luteoviolacea]|uniref:LysR family transcriptional regulator n=1 Tax=Pseudoalteromonas luteoviolacea S4060-1 TaxID=1365257 RepID=A0A167NU39_9GAMM|nr:LysR family transcriptional regulator [Pseudoalteromonas luteoviolacea]KZN68795.1 LysR family transcriptional regulator [Pseudoalteromonas luteoviolacea S4060-1]